MQFSLPLYAQILPAIRPLDLLSFYATVADRQRYFTCSRACYLTTARVSSPCIDIQGCCNNATTIGLTFLPSSLAVCTLFVKQYELLGLMLGAVFECPCVRRVRFNTLMIILGTSRARVRRL